MRRKKRKERCWFIWSSPQKHFGSVKHSIIMSFGTLTHTNTFLCMVLSIWQKINKFLWHIEANFSRCDSEPRCESSAGELNGELRFFLFVIYLFIFCGRHIPCFSEQCQSCQRGCWFLAALNTKCKCQNATRVLYSKQCISVTVLKLEIMVYVLKCCAVCKDFPSTLF